MILNRRKNQTKQETKNELKINNFSENLVKSTAKNGHNMPINQPNSHNIFEKSNKSLKKDNSI